MSDDPEIPGEWKQRSPLMTAASWRNLDRLRQHPHAPRWNFETGDRLIAGDLEHVDAFREALAQRDQLPSAGAAPPEWMLDQIRSLRQRSWYVEEQLPPGFDLDRDWTALPTMSRDALATRISEVVPHDIKDLDRLLSYDTSGTSGHAVVVPHDPVVLAKAHTFAELAMQRHGASPVFGSDGVACLNLCAQVHTYVFASVFNVWNGAGFVKANLAEKDWAGGKASAREFLGDIDAQLVTSDPISLAEAMRWSVDLTPKAVISTAVALQPELRRDFSRHFGCPVIDWYSTTETGPIACSAPEGDDLEILPHDMFVETLDEHGVPVPDGEVGEITVTTLRNPYLPLIRYRTGDFARLHRGAIPRLSELQGREPVFFRAASGALVSAVDVGRAMRLVATFAQHEFVQRADGSCAVTLRAVPGIGVDPLRVAHALEELLGHEVEVRFDEELGHHGKARTYRREPAT